MIPLYKHYAHKLELETEASVFAATAEPTEPTWITIMPSTILTTTQLPSTIQYTNTYFIFGLPVNTQDFVIIISVVTSTCTTVFIICISMYCSYLRTRLRQIYLRRIVSSSSSLDSVMSASSSSSNYSFWFDDIYAEEDANANHTTHINFY